MRTLLVVLFLKTSPGLLLLPPGPCRRIRRFPLQRLMQPFPTSVLLRLAGVNPLRDDPQLQPPYRQPRQSAHGQRRQRWPLVGAQRSRQSILAESRFPHCFHLPLARARQQLTAQQATAASSAQRQRLAALPVGGQKPALEVSSPQRIRLPGMRQRLAPGCCPPPPLGPYRQPLLLQNPRHRRRRRPGSPGVFALPDRLPLLGSPVGQLRTQPQALNRPIHSYTVVRLTPKRRASSALL